MIELIDKRRFDDITVADISEKSEVSVGAFYHYFSSKNDILAEIFNQVDEHFSTVVISGLKNKR